MTVKRISDLILAVMLVLPAVAILGILSVVLVVVQGRPVLFLADRMRAPGQSFRLVKLRTMEACSQGRQRVLGGDMHDRVTPLGRWLRRTRLDELPQLWNVLRGDMSFVGPRPPLDVLVAAAPDAYAEILRDRPGISGLATVIVCGREERLLARCRSAAETQETYLRRCLPQKLRIDRLYTRNASLALDVYVLYLTAARIVRLPGRRAARLWRDARRDPSAAPGRHAPQPDRAQADSAPALVAVAAPQLSRNARLK
ncbi:sugar transferase [Palleronia sp. KMU-117]|uniref:sugar transferase n=1 Tax=Palleronia sp. KMU-117 TaxID=3434108 RepID=UPI003D75171B